MDKIEMSLDEIIKTNKIGFRRGGGGRGRMANGAGGRGGRQSGRGIRRGGGIYRNGSTTTANGRSTGTGGSGVLKGRSRGAIIQRSKYPRGDVNSTWKHDMYDGIKKTNRTSGALGLGGIGGVGGGGGGGPTKLIVSNLDYGVSETDIHELFADFGPLKSASVHYDRSGRSLGTADVVFERRPDAVKAMKQYNGVPLDGRPMVIQLATSELVQQPAVVVRRSMRPTISQPAYRRRGVGGRPGGRFQSISAGGGGGGGRSNGRQPQTKLSAEELDAELDAYVNDMK